MPSKFFKLCILPLLLLAACTPQKSLLENLGGEETGIFSNRQIHQDEFIAIIKLQSPPLLATAQQVNGKTQVDPKSVQSLENEQASAIADLKKLSSDIRILFKYRMVLNGFAIIAPISLLEQLKSQVHVAYIEKEGSFGRPVIADKPEVGTNNLASIVERNSVKFIGADKVHQMGFDGTGMKVGIIDTGIDYTHAMFGGPGTEEAYKAIDPSKPYAGFPTAKVAGGIDLAGTAYDSGSAIYQKHLPIPDENPLDEAGHGSHVSGTVAGIGDGIETYSGVAPGAVLYAIKVFGAAGSTGDAVIIAALEYAADPNRDADSSDKMDVVNMSLGSSYGNPHILYGEAVRNLSSGGTVVVASAGNEGNRDYIVGAPSVVDEAISVAASIDDAAHNWNFAAVKFTSSVATHLAEAIEGPISKPIAEAGPIAGPLVFVGTADKDFTPEIAGQLKGKVAFVDRGIVPFSEKIRRAFEAGAIGVVVGNNQPGNPISMGGEGNYAIPAVMVTQAMADTLKAEMKTSEVSIQFQTADKIEKPELIDTLTDFSSKGPRSIDGLLKPEISAPGSNVISAAMGKGNKGVKFSGTSMSGPHVTGVMTLLKQIHPEMSSLELKSILMGHAKSISDEKKVNYQLSRQGAGRVQADQSALARVVASKTAFSLGEINIEFHKVLATDVRIRNISKDKLSMKVEMTSDAGLILENPQDLELAPGEEKNVALRFRLDVSHLSDIGSEAELDGLLKLTAAGIEIHRIPVLALIKKISQVRGTALTVHSSSEVTSAGSLSELTLGNSGKQKGLALPFNLLGFSTRKEDATQDIFMSHACDLQAVGYRIVDKAVGDQKLKVLQVGVKLYDAMTTWNACEVSVLIDSNGDDQPEQELAGIALGNVKGLSTATNAAQFMSVLLDATKARAIRQKFEEDSVLPVTKEHPKPEENYAPAALDSIPMTVFNHSSIMIVEADVTKLAKRPNGQLAIKVATIFNDASAVEMDDYLGNDAKRWLKISLDENSQAYKNLPESLTLPAGQSASAVFDKGQAPGKLMLLMPDNRTVSSDLLLDSQMQILSPTFAP